MKTLLRILGVLAALLTLVAAIIALITAIIEYSGVTNGGTPPNSKASKTVEASATQDWQNTGINLRAGQEVSLTVESGSWTYTVGSEPYQNGDSEGGYICGGEGCVEQLPTAPTGALIGKVGDEIFLVGSKTNLVAPMDGFLFLRINDGDISDNDGILVVKITVN